MMNTRSIPLYSRFAALWRTPNGLAILNNGFSAVLGFSSFVLLARTLPPGELGPWALFLSGSILLDMLRYGLVQTGLVRYFAGASEEEGHRVEASGLGIFLAITLLLSGGLFAFRHIVADSLASSPLRLFVEWYPLYAIITVPHAFAEWISQARKRFDRILLIRLLVRGGFLAYLAANYFSPHGGVENVVVAYCVVNAGVSAFTLIAGWVRIHALRLLDWPTARKLLHYGKFSTSTVVGANLLRTSDSFFIGHFLGAAAAAQYAVPLKLLELIEMPVRGIGATAFPEMSQHSNQGNLTAIRKLFLRNVSMVTVILLPVLLLSFIFAEELVVLLGGAQYRDTAIIIRILTVYCLFIPFDRYAGIVLDSMNKPQLNALKVWLMLAVNIIGDAIAIQYAGTLSSLALASIVTYATGFALNLLLLRTVLDWRFSARRFFHALPFGKFSGTQGNPGGREKQPYQGPSGVVLAGRRILFTVPVVMGLHHIARFLLRRQPRVLSFHSVARSREATRANRYLHADADTFRKQMKHLSRYYTVVSTNDVNTSLQQGHQAPANSIALVFDDGYENTRTVAYPVLKQHSMPFTIALISRVCDGDYVPWDARISIAQRKKMIEARSEEAQGATPTEFSDLAVQFIRRGHQFRRALMERLSHETGLRWTVGEIRKYDPELLGLTWEEIREMVKDPLVGIAAHTASHAVLNHYDTASMMSELMDSKRAIEQHTGRSCDELVYPTGVVDSRIKKAVAQAGFKNAYGLAHRTRTPDDDSLELPRIGVPPCASYEEFVCRVSGLFILPVAAKKAAVKFIDRLKSLLRNDVRPSPAERITTLEPVQGS